MKKSKDRFYYKVLPKVVDWLTSISVRRASKKLKIEKVKRLLLDNTVLHHGVTHETAWIATGPENWGDIEIDTGYAARIPVYDDSDRTDAGKSVKYLPGIVSLAKQGSISLAISEELQDEQWTQPVGRFRGYGIYDFYFFKDLKLEVIKDPDYTITIGPSHLGIPSLEEQRKRRLEAKTGPLYRSLVSVLGPKNSQDAWHITTAERNDCYCFLTMDFKLIKNVRAQSKNSAIKSLKTKVMTPEEFGKRFNLVPINPRLYSYHRADYPVKHDTNWPDSKRRKPSRKHT
jgi:hypothetical protein